MLFTYELARRIEGTGATATVLHPGVSRTAFRQKDSLRWMRLVLPLLRPFMKTFEHGAATSIHLAISPEVAGVSGAALGIGAAWFQREHHALGVPFPPRGVCDSLDDEGVPVGDRRAWGCELRQRT